MKTNIHTYTGLHTYICRGKLGKLPSIRMLFIEIKPTCCKYESNYFISGSSVIELRTYLYNNSHFVTFPEKIHEKILRCYELHRAEQIHAPTSRKTFEYIHQHSLDRSRTVNLHLV